jgi:hypothetical protein
MLSLESGRRSRFRGLHPDCCTSFARVVIACIDSRKRTTRRNIVGTGVGLLEFVNQILSINKPVTLTMSVDFEMLIKYKNL